MKNVIVDLDSIFEKFIKYMLLITKPNKCYRKKMPNMEDLEFEINWKNVVISHDEVEFTEKITNIPSSIPLFKTEFTNRTSTIII